MKNEFDKLFENHYGMSQKDLLSLESLCSLIEEQVSVLTEAADISTMTGAQKAERLMLALPKFTPSEAWGKPNSVARDEITKFFNKIRGKTFSEKFDYIKRLYEQGNKITSPSRIISTLIVLESLAACITAFNSASAGFVFEGFLAALLDGVQIDDTLAGTLPIEDIIGFMGYGDEKEVPMSLKMLTEKSSSIEGSYTNLINGLNRFESGSVTYIVVLKQKVTAGGGSPLVLSVHEFKFTRDNVIENLVKGSRANQNLLLLKSPKTGKTFNLNTSLRYLRSAQTWEEKYALLQNTEGFNPRLRQPEKKETPEPEPTHDPQDLGSELADTDTPSEEVVQAAQPDQQDIAAEGLVMSEGKIIREAKGGTERQWKFTQPAMKKLDTHHLHGGIDVTPEQLKKIAENYMEHLGDQVIILFETVKELSENINKYFTHGKRGDAISAGRRAVGNANQIEKGTREHIEQEKRASAEM